MTIVSIWADKHRICSSTNGSTPEVIAMCKNSSTAMMLVDAWIAQMKQQQYQPSENQKKSDA